MLGLEDRVTCVVEGPILVQQSSLGFHLPEQRRRRIRSKDVKSCTLQTVLFNPFRGARKNIFAIVIEAQYERAIHLDAAIVQHAHPAGIVRGLGRLFVRLGQVVVAERFEPNKNACASCQCHVANEAGVIGNIN